MKGRAAIRKVAPDFVTGIFLILSLNVYSYTIDIHQTPSHLYTVETSQGDYLLDTGSSYVVLTHSMQKKTNTGPITRMRVRLADGQVVSGEKYLIKEINLNGCLIKNVEGMTLSHGDRNILGMSVIEKISPVTIDVANKRVIFTCDKTVYKLKCRGCQVYL